MNKHMLLMASTLFAVGAAQAADNQQNQDNQHNYIMHFGTDGITAVQMNQENSFVGMSLGQVVAHAMQNNNNGSVKIGILFDGTYNAAAFDKDDDASSVDESQGAQHQHGHGQSCCHIS